MKHSVKVASVTTGVGKKSKVILAFPTHPSAVKTLTYTEPNPEK